MTQPRGLRNCNPGNIRNNSDKFQGEIIPSQDRSFKQFKTMAYGYRAMIRIIINYHNKYGLKTIDGIVRRWAPHTENDTEQYIKTVSNHAGIASNVVLNIRDKEQICKVVAAMSLVENGKLAKMPDERKCFDML